MLKEMLLEIRKELDKISNPEKIMSSQRFFIESIKTRGVVASDVKILEKKYFKKIDAMDKNDVFSLAEELMKSDYNEEFFIACTFVYRIRKSFTLHDFQIFERWVFTYINNWAKCDTFCNHSMAELLEMYPGLMKNLKLWTSSDNIWVKRASAVTLIIPARKGKFVDDILEIATMLLEDSNDMVQKGYGWMLKALGQYNPDIVYEFVTKHHDKMPRTAFRYALEKLPVDMRKAAMNLGKKDI